SATLFCSCSLTDFFFPFLLSYDFTNPPQGYFSSSTMRSPPSKPRFLKNCICWLLRVLASVSLQKGCPTVVVGTLAHIRREAASLGARLRASRAPPMVDR